MLTTAVLLMAVGTGAPAAAKPVAVTVGLEVRADDPAVAERLRAGFGTAAAGDAAAAVTVKPGCDDVTFCVSVVVVPIRLGRRAGGWSVAAHVSRRLLAHPNWPWPPLAPAQPEGSSPVTIVDSYTAGGNAGCAPCQRELERLQREVADARRVAEPTMVDEGDLQLVLGPDAPGFLTSAGAGFAKGLMDRHVRPWLASGGGARHP